MYDLGYTKCKCPVVIRGTLNGKRIMQATSKFLRAPMDRDLDAASKLAQVWERAGAVVPMAYGVVAEDSGKSDAKASVGVLIEEAVTAYLNAARARGNNESTMLKKEVCFARRFTTDPKNPTGPKIPTRASSLQAFCDKHGIRFLHELTLAVVEDWRASWNVQALERSKRQGRALGFFWFCERRGWFPPNFAHNLTEGLGVIQVQPTQTGYFEPAHYKKLIDTTYVYSDRPSIDNHNTLTIGGHRIRAVAELMRWTGLRIRDAATLERRKLVYDDRTDMWSVIVYQRKTGDPVYCPIPPHVCSPTRLGPL